MTQGTGRHRPGRTARSGPLREGFTTGSAATAAALAALRLLLSGQAPDSVDIPLPPITDGRERARLRVHVAACGSAAASPAGTFGGQAPPRAAWALVIKDGGDDPDATVHARIRADVTVRLEATTPGAPRPSLRITLDGGRGVGRVTLPGLPVPVGEAAINPVPRMQIAHALREACAASGLGGSISVVISVEDGELLARQTMNARLGIVGGISILGTQGIVKPFSHDAWRASIAEGLDVAAALRCPAVALSTGRRSERLLMRERPDLPEQAFVQAADFAAFSLREAGRRGFPGLIWGCFFGKLVKLAQGMEYTHAREGEPDMALLARHAAAAGLRSPHMLETCVTASHALDILLGDPAGRILLRRLGAQARTHAAAFAGRPVTLYLFHLDGRTLLTL